MAGSKFKCIILLSLIVSAYAADLEEQCPKNNMIGKYVSPSGHPDELLYTIQKKGPSSTLCGDLRPYLSYCTTKTIKTLEDRLNYLRNIFESEPEPFRKAVSKKMQENDGDRVLKSYYEYLFAQSSQVDNFIPECYHAILQYYRGMLCSSCRCGSTFTGKFDVGSDEHGIPYFFLQRATSYYIFDSCVPVLKAVYQLYGSLYEKILPDATEEVKNEIVENISFSTQFEKILNSITQYSLIDPILAFFWIDVPRTKNVQPYKIYPHIGPGFIPITYSTHTDRQGTHEAFIWGSFELHKNKEKTNNAMIIFIAAVLIVSVMIIIFISYVVSLFKKRRRRNDIDFFVDEILHESPPGKLKSIVTSSGFHYWDDEYFEVPFYK